MGTDPAGDVKENLSATRIDLGVFENNESARHCYEAAGFKEYAQRACEMPAGTWNCTDMELFIEKPLADKKQKKIYWLVSLGLAVVTITAWIILCKIYVYR